MNATRTISRDLKKADPDKLTKLQKQDKARGEREEASRRKVKETRKLCERMKKECESACKKKTEECERQCVEKYRKCKELCDKKTAYAVKFSTDQEKYCELIVANAKADAKAYAKALMPKL